MAVRRALITGASRGIGAGIARSLAADGHRVVIGFLEQKQAALDVVASIRDCGGEAQARQFDVADADGVKSALDELGTKLDPFDIVVNNAAITRDAVFPAMSRSDWRLVLDTVR